MKLLDVTGTHQTAQSSPWKERIPFWMEHIALGGTPSQSVPRLQGEQVMACLQFNMVAGVRPVLQHQRPLTSMENLQLVDQMVRADHGLIKFMSLTVRRCFDVGPSVTWKRHKPLNAISCQPSSKFFFF